MEKIVIFGAGNTGKLANEYLKGRYDCVYFVDNDSSKWGTIFCGKQILSPEKLKEDKNIKVIINIFITYNRQKATINIKN